MHPDLGQLIEGEAHRDAIHIAIAPVIAAEVLKPGQHVRFADPNSPNSPNSMWKVEAVVGQIKVGDMSAKPIGIVDPFLLKPVQPGERFYVCLYPKTITALRHDWEHPLFTAQEVGNKLAPSIHEQWLRNFAEQIDVSYEQLMEKARQNQLTGEWWSEGDKFEGIDYDDAFWDHYQAVTGDQIRERGSFFSCAC